MSLEFIAKSSTPSSTTSKKSGLSYLETATPTPSFTVPQSSTVPTEIQNPVSTTKKTSLLGNLFDKIDSTISNNKIDISQKKTEPLSTKSIQLPEKKLPAMQFRVGENLTPTQTEIAYKNISTPNILKTLDEKISDKVINTPIKYLGDKLYEANKDYFDQVAFGIGQEPGRNLGEKVLEKAQFGLGTLSGLSGGIIKPDYYENGLKTEGPSDLLGKAIYTLSEGVGMATGIGLIERGLFSSLRAPEALTASLKSYPKVATYFDTLARNIPAFLTYGQLDLDQTNKERLQRIGADLASAPLFTAIGMIGDKKLSIPASGIIGFGIAKLSGASNEDAIASGIAFSLLDLVGGPKGVRSKDLITGQDARNVLNHEAIEVINKYSTTKLTEKSSASQIDRAFKEAAVKTHPDVGGSQKEFSAVSNARDILLGKKQQTPLENTSPDITKEDITKTAEQAKSNTALKRKEITDIVPTSESKLIEEAKKYKSSEEFIKSQGEKVFSGSDNEVKTWHEVSVRGGGTVYRGLNEWGDGIYVTESPEYAKTYGEKVTESVIKPNLKLFDAREGSELTDKEKKLIIDSFKRNYKKSLESGFTKDITKELENTDDARDFFDILQSEIGTYTTDILKDVGFEGIVADESKMNGGNVIGGKVYNIFDYSNIKTKSQLTDIYNNAHRINSQQRNTLTAQVAKELAKELNLTDEQKALQEELLATAMSGEDVSEIQKKIDESYSPEQRAVIDNFIKNKNNETYDDTGGKRSYRQGGSKEEVGNRRVSGNTELLQRVSRDQIQRSLFDYARTKASDVSRLALGEGEKILDGQTVEISDTTIEVLRGFGMSDEFIKIFDNQYRAGGMATLSMGETYQGKKVYGGYSWQDTEGNHISHLHLNTEDIHSPLYESGAILNHEIYGHSWHAGLSENEKREFFSYLKSSRDTILNAWKISADKYTPSNHSTYWIDTIDWVHDNLFRRTKSHNIADQILNQVSLQKDISITIDQFVDRTLNFQEDLDKINDELQRLGYTNIPFFEYNTPAALEHVAIIAEVASDITSEQPIIQAYINRVNDGSLTFRQPAQSRTLTPTVLKKVQEVFDGYMDMTTRILDKLRGRTTVSKQFISDLTNSGDLKQVERDLIRTVLETEGDTVNVTDFAEKVKAELLPLTIKLQSGTGRQVGYEFVSLKEDRGDVKNYTEHVYESPIKTSAGNIHFPGDTDNYFGHTRIEDMADDTTRRIIEVQSDLYQKGNLEREKLQRGDLSVAQEKSYGTPEEIKQWDAFSKKNMESGLSNEEKNTWDKLAKSLYERASKERDIKLQKLQQYNNPTAHFRMVREEIKRAAQDGKTKLQFPTGETAMKIEGLGENVNFFKWDTRMGGYTSPMKPEDLEVGMGIWQSGNQNWIITDVLGDGKFKAVPKSRYEELLKLKERGEIGDGTFKASLTDRNSETFDISGKVDTNNPIYRFYEKDLGRYLANNYGAKEITDTNGVSWIEVPIKEEYIGPITAFKQKPEDEKTPQDLLNEAEVNASALGSPEKAFNLSKDQKVLTTLPSGINVVIGSYGENAINRKTSDGKPDRLPISDIPDTLKYVKNVYTAGNSPFRKGNIVIVSQMPDQEIRALITRKNANGDEEVINFFKVSQNPRKFIENLKQFGTPGGTRTHNELFRTQLSGPSGGDIQTLPDTGDSVQSSELEPVDNQSIDTLLNPPDTEIPSNKERLDELQFYKEYLADRIQNHPGKILNKFISKKEGQFVDLKDPNDPSLSPSQKEVIKKRNEKILSAARGAFDEIGIDSTDLSFDNPDVIREQIDAYHEMQDQYKTVIEEEKLLKKQDKEELAQQKEAEKKYNATTRTLNTLARRADIERERLQKQEEKKRAMEETDAKLRKIQEEAQMIRQKREYAQNAPLPEPLSFMKSINARLRPLKYLPEETKKILKEWYRGRLRARIAANDEAEKLAFIPARKGLETILSYEKGNLTGRADREIGKVFKEMHDEAEKRLGSVKNTDLDIPERANYLPHVYANDDRSIMEAIKKYLTAKGLEKAQIEEYIKGKVLNTETASRLKLTPNFVKSRVFPTYEIAIKYGLTPKYTHPAQLAAYYREQLENAVNNNNFLNKLEQEAQILPHDAAPSGWKNIDVPFRRNEVYKAPPQIAKTINGLWRDESNLGVTEQFLKKLGKVSGALQDMVMTSGIPWTQVNAFSINTAILDLTRGDTKSAGAIIRANANGASRHYFEANRKYMRMLANQGVDIGHTISDYQNAWTVLRADKNFRQKFYHKIGTGVDDMFSKKVFESYIPQTYIELFKNTYEAMIKDGIPPDVAEKQAADILKITRGVSENEPFRSKTVQDFLKGFFFAPRYRQMILRVWGNMMKGMSTEFRNSSYKNMRKLFIGALLTFTIYNLLNKKLNGTYMWGNESGHEFDLKIPTKDGIYVYVPFLPGSMATIRNIASGTLNLLEGNINTAIQKYSSFFSIPIKTIGEVLSNQDYFGNPIYQETDTGAQKVKKIALYIGTSVIHPYIKQLVNYIDGQPLYQTLSYAFELPFKYSSEEKESKKEFFNALDKQAKERADLKRTVLPIYDKVKEMGFGTAESNAYLSEQLNNLPDPDAAYEVYKSLKTADKSSTTRARTAEMYNIVKHASELGFGTPAANEYIQGQIVDAKDYEIYKSVKKKFFPTNK